ncbi:MAG: hypothetical protein A2651_04025 [Candidatus Yanofskybacteria bacterium RIFCSPHIGHO2_01_FULL_42_12]|nr:MAG: hypothetical protein A2651_04025 [Candidatus Yanofskybacteria bacterium RIFCSPHIGHO2_01_FULL_42_12]
MTKSILVCFEEGLPKRFREKFDEVLNVEALESLVSPGSVEDASQLVRELSLLTDSSGRRISKSVNYKGSELWWMNYDNLMYKFCLPYTQYERLLEHLKNFQVVYLYEPPFPDLFRYYLESHGVRCEIESKLQNRFSVGILIQAALSLPFLFWLRLRSPKLMVWAGDRLDLPRDYNFRMRFIYEELRGRKIKFAEFIRSMESSPTVLKHAMIRKRSVIYSYAIVTLVRSIADLLVAKEKIDVKEGFWSKVAVHYIQNVRSDIWAIRAMKFILKFIGIKAAIIPGAINRNFPEVLACKLLGIKTVGIQHGLHPKSYFVSDFMHEFDGEKTLSVDKYGLWSEWWRQYYLKYSKAYKPEQLYVSGLMRPLEEAVKPSLGGSAKFEGEPIKVLFVAEELAAPEEIMPYLEALIEDKSLSLYIKFRPYKDGFEEWLTRNRPELLKKFSQERILKTSMSEAIGNTDVAVGSQSAGVLESVLQLKPFVLFWTEKWGDFFSLKSNYPEYNVFVESPSELVARLKNLHTISPSILKKLQEDLFGDPYRNGSKWVVDQAEAVLTK